MISGFEQIVREFDDFIKMTETLSFWLIGNSDFILSSCGYDMD
jgi:hypothetical protein